MQAHHTVSLTLTVEETAHALGISRTLAYEAARTGELPTIRIGRRLLVPKAALDRLLSQIEPLPSVLALDAAEGGDRNAR